MAAEEPPSEAPLSEAPASEAPLSTAPLREPARRLFYALWPDEAMREAMARATREAAQGSGGRPVPADNLHVTLAFLGSVPERRLHELAAIAQEAAETFRPVLAAASSRDGAMELAFDRLEYWRAAKLICALPAEPPAPVAALARKLQDLLVSRGFTPDLKPFRPHVTVVRKVARPGPIGQMPAVLWRFTELALVESRTLPAGAVYSLLRSFAIQ